jgi:DNA adenine methylase
MKPLTQPIKYHGGKYYLAKRIIELMPRHMHYVEPFFGGGSVLLQRDPLDQSLWLNAKDKGVSELINDIDDLLMTFWNVLRDPSMFRDFKDRVSAIPLSRVSWAESHKNMIFPPTKSPVDRAIDFFVNARQSLGGRGNTFTSITRNRTRRGMNGNASEWIGAVDGLEAVHHRLRSVVIESMDFEKLIKREDTPHTLFYCDPPYLKETVVSEDVYYFTMTGADHERLLNVLLGIKGKVILSGYRSDMYDRALKHFDRVEIDIPNNAAGGKTKRRMKECLWMNYSK